MSTSIATCAADGDVGDAVRSAVTSIATCVANGVVVGAAAVTWGDGGLCAAGEAGTAPTCAGSGCAAAAEGEPGAAPTCVGSGCAAAAEGELGSPQAAAPKCTGQLIEMPPVSHCASTDAGDGKEIVAVGSQVSSCHSVRRGFICHWTIAPGMPGSQGSQSRWFPLTLQKNILQQCKGTTRWG